MDTKNISKKYRPIPFWSWNEKLECAETAEQVSLMNDVGIGGFFMHARGGLQTEYMGEEWFDNIEAATKKAEELGMRPWAYDENGWPSGFGNGMVNGLGVEYQQKYLRMENTLEHNETAICKSGEHYFYYDINPFYVDVLDKKVVKEFIDSTYLPYYEKFGNRIEGFFTDEPQISRSGIPWSFVFEDEYKARYGEDLYESLEELFLPIGNYKETRIKFWKMVTDLFSEGFCKQIYDWCDERGLKLTGHLVLEETLGCQLETNGACMPHYEYFHIPGMDWLGREVREGFTARQVSSVSEQLGKEAVLSETFALCGHDVSLAELKGIYEWQMVRGINLLCQHLEGYSIRGIRKRDYPPAMYKQQPWWGEYDKWVDAMSRIGMIMTKGKACVDVLLLHPQTTAWTLFDGAENEAIDALTDKTLGVIRVLEQKKINFHLGDETIMERHAKVENGKLVIGKQAYSYIIDECCEEYLPTTRALLDEYKAQGGKIVSAEEIEANDITDNKDLTYAVRYFDDMTVHYFVNTSGEEKTAEIKAEGRVLDIYTGDLLPFDGVHTFEPWGSLMLFEDGTKNIPRKEAKKAEVFVEGEFKICDKVMNTLTLDKCDYYFDGVLQEKDGYVLNIAERANSLGRKVNIHQDYHVKIDEIPEDLYLVCENPENFEIKINGKVIDKTVKGWFVDKSFLKIDIKEYVAVGENTISFDCDFAQADEFYENLKKAWIFESEKNKLVYDMEIEAIYLLGSFGVKTDGKWETLERDAVRYSGDFVIGAPETNVVLKNLEKQGFPFFCGSMTLEGEIDIAEPNSILVLDKKGVSVASVKVGGVEKTLITDSKCSLEGVPCGKQKITITITNNLRNLLGPHHLEEGESYWITPAAFFKEKCIWLMDGCNDWNDDYCFVETGV